MSIRVRVSKPALSSNKSHYIIKRLKESKYLYLLFALPLVYFIIFKYGAMFWLVIAFQKFDAVKGVWKSDWIGFKNFLLFINDPYFWKLIRNTIMLNIYGIVFYFPVPIILALMINEVRSRYFKKFVQTISYLPYFVSTVVVCGLIVSYLATDGMINDIVKSLFGQPITFLMEPKYFRGIYVLSDIWQYAGWGSIIYLAALTGVDPQLYESAHMDGATKWKQTFYISIPSIAPVISIQFLLSVGQLLSVGFEKILLLYNGSIYETADVISTYIFRRAIYSADYSFGAAVSIFQAVIGLVLVVSANHIAKKVNATSLW